MLKQAPSNTEYPREPSVLFKTVRSLVDLISLRKLDVGFLDRVVGIPVYEQRRKIRSWLSAHFASTAPKIIKNRAKDSYPLFRARIPALDSLRFIAAMMVFIAHFNHFFGDYIDFPAVMRPYMSATAAVIFFFVLSGFVLQVSGLQAANSFWAYCKFLCRRAFRIYPLFYFSILLALAIVYFSPSNAISLMPPEAKSVYNSDLSSLSNWIHQLSLISPKFDFRFLNPPSWTLTVEMRVSFVLPSIFLAFSKISRNLSLLLLVLLLPVCIFLSKISGIGTFGMLPLFGVGAFLVSFPIRSEGRMFIPVITGVLGFLLLFPAVYFAASMRVTPEIAYALCAVGSVFGIQAVLSSPKLQSLLSWRPLAALGAWSYGFYLLHYPVLILTVLLFAEQPLAIKLCFSVSLTVLLAWLSYRFLEIPMIHIGKKLTNMSAIKHKPS